jgi:hypothetical protein
LSYSKKSFEVGAFHEVEDAWSSLENDQDRYGCRDPGGSRIDVVEMVAILVGLDRHNAQLSPASRPA